MRIFWSLCLLLIVCFSCSEETQNESDFVAGDLFTDSNIRVVLIDTLSIEATTFKFDSIVSSEVTRALVGKYSDTVFGEVKTSSFFEIAPTSYTIDTESVYDSVVLHLKLDKYYYNDTLQENTIHVKRLKSTYKSEDGYFYNTTVMPTFDEDLAVITYHPRPLDSDTLQIRLSDTLGMELFDKLQQKNISNFDEFQEYFKGIGLEPGENDNGSIIGFSVQTGASFVRLYHSTSEIESRVQSYNDFNITTTDGSTISCYNRIEANEPNEYLQKLETKELNLLSSYAGNRSYIQCGTGICTRLQFPSVKDLYDIKGEGTILGAVLKIRPAKRSYNDHVILRDSLQVYVVDRNNDITEQLLLNSSSAVNGILNKEGQEFNDVFYELPMGAYIEKLLLAEQETEEAIILFPSNYNSTVDRFVLGGDSDTKYDAILEVTYAIYDED